MSEQRLAELIDELAAAVPAPDPGLVDGAWLAAQRRRRRRTMLASAGAVVVLAVAGSGAIRGGSGAPDPAPPVEAPTPSPTSDEGAPRPPSTSYRGVPVWWAPSMEDEEQLPWLDAGSLPRVIDLSADQPRAVGGQPALAVYIVHDLEKGEPVRFVLLSADGTTAELPADRVEPNRDQDGNGGALTPFNGGMAPDGGHVLFAQQSSIELYDVDKASWTSIDTADWVAEGARWLDPRTIWVPDDVADSVGTTYDTAGRVLDTGVSRTEPDLAVADGDQPYGIWVDGPPGVAGSYFLAGPVAGGSYSNPEGIIASTGTGRSVLALSAEGRGKGCCPVVGWLGDDATLLFQSGSRLLAWQVETGALFRVADVAGLGDGEGGGGSWAWRALPNAD